MKEKIEDALKVLKECKEEFKQWVKDQSVPLDERWNLFIQSKLGDHRHYYERFANFPSDGYYDDFFWDRHMTITVDNMYEAGLDREGYLDTQDKADEFREDVLRQFIYSFNIDW